MDNNIDDDDDDDDDIKDDDNELIKLINYLKNKKYITKLNKYKTCIPLTYHDLCNRCSSILKNVDEQSNKVLIYHIIEHQTEILVQTEE